MEIKTKYNIKDECWFIFDNRIQKLWISRIEITKFFVCGTTKQTLFYTLGQSIVLSEEKLFSTKEDLLKSL